MEGLFKFCLGPLEIQMVGAPGPSTKNVYHRARGVCTHAFPAAYGLMNSGLPQNPDCSISIVDALEMLQLCAKPSVQSF